jgi:formamidopyrimidine-DNA glycosylase
MPELPDIVVYLEALKERVLGHVLVRIQIVGPFLLRTANPPIAAIQGHSVKELKRLGKRIALKFDNQLWLVFHLMIAGRLHWSERRMTVDGRRTLAACDFDNGTLTMTEAGTKKRASVHLLEGDEELSSVLTSSNHTIKRALTDPHLFSGIGNAYSDEILHQARLSPVKLTQRLKSDEIERLYEAIKQTLTEWTQRLREKTGNKFPEKVTAFREGMEVHGRYGLPCPVCGTKIQRIRYASNETNYCPQCQTEGKLLADRALSRLLREDWPRSLEELEGRFSR